MVKVEGVKELESNIDRMLKRLDRKERIKILRKGANLIRDAAKSHVPEATHPVHRYSTPKALKRIRAPKGKGVIAATYMPGHLRQAISSFTLRKSDDVFVGPRRRGPRTPSGVYGGSSRRTDPYYAHMVHNGTVDQAPVPFMTMGFNERKSQAKKVIVTELKKKIEQ